jgi:hypothetical protein
VGLFCLGGTALLATNYLRFGSGFESGRSLRLDSLTGTMFASRFSHPFASETLSSAARELFSLFFHAGGNLNGSEWYKSTFFPGQSATFRWRELNFNTYGLIGLGLMILAWGIALRRWLQSRRSVVLAKPPESVVTTTWSSRRCSSST